MGTTDFHHQPHAAHQHQQLLTLLCITKLHLFFPTQTLKSSQWLPRLLTRSPPPRPPPLPLRLPRRRMLARRPPLPVTPRSAPRAARRPTLPTSTRSSSRSTLTLVSPSAPCLS